jgi:hypothetical protein
LKTGIVAEKSPSELLSASEIGATSLEPSYQALKRKRADDGDGAMRPESGTGDSRKEQEGSLPKIVKRMIVSKYEFLLDMQARDHAQATQPAKEVTSDAPTAPDEAMIPIAQSPPPDVSTSTLRKDLAQLVSFEVSDYMAESGAVLARYDTILCMSLTKWIHVNNGDDGLMRFFRKLHDSLECGGILVIEPQPWTSYKVSRSFFVLFFVFCLFAFLFVCLFVFCLRLYFLI